jgi:DHA1 family tetracycline resistance protein-like MFS transporter
MTQQIKQTLSLWLVLLIVFLDWVGIGLVYPMFSSMLFNPECPILACDASHTERSLYLGFLLAAMPIAQFLSGPILGALSDQKGRRPLFLWSLSLAVIGYAAASFGVWMESVFILIASRFVTGIAAGNSSVVSATIADISTHENKPKHFGLYSAACGVGFTVGPFLGGFLSEISFSLPFVVAGIACLLNLQVIYSFFHETNISMARKTIQWIKGLQNLKKALQMADLRAVFLTVFIFCFGWSFFYEFLPVAWIYDYHLHPSQIGSLFAYSAFFYAISAAYLIRPITGRFDHRKVFFYTLIALGVTILSLLICPPFHWIWFYMPIINYLVALIFPTSTTLISNWASKETQGETLGILSSVQAAAFALSPLSAGSALAANPHMQIVVGGISMLVAAIVLKWLLRENSQPA